MLKEIEKGRRERLLVRIFMDKNKALFRKEQGL